MPLSTFLNGGTITQLRGLAWLALSARGSVGNLAGTSDSGGGATRTWTYGTSLPCRVDPMGGGESEVADRISDRSTHLITTLPEVTIGHEDRFAVEGEVYEITAVRDATDEWLRTLEAVKLD